MGHESCGDHGGNVLSSLRVQHRCDALGYIPRGVVRTNVHQRLELQLDHMLVPLGQRHVWHVSRQQQHRDVSDLLSDVRANPCESIADEYAKANLVTNSKTDYIRYVHSQCGYLTGIYAESTDR